MVNLNTNFSALLIGCIAAFLPLYIRISSFNLERVSKSNALFCLIPILILFFDKKLREIDITIKSIALAMMSHVILIQFEPSSITGIYKSLGICLSVLFVIKYYESYDEKDNEIIFNLFCVGALIQTSLAIFQSFQVDPYTSLLLLLDPTLTVQGEYVTTDLHHVYGSLQNPNVLGAYLALCLPAFFRKKWIYLAVPVFLVILKTKSIMPIAAATGAISYYFLSNSKIKDYIFYVGSTIGFYVICFMLPNLGSGRLEIWKVIFSLTTVKQLILGGSPSWLVHQKVSYNGLQVIQEHNEYMAALNIFGVFSLVAICFILYLIINNQSKNKIFGAIFFAAFINMHGNFPLHIASTAFIILIAFTHCLRGNYGVNLDR